MQLYDPCGTLSVAYHAYGVGVDPLQEERHGTAVPHQMGDDVSGVEADGVTLCGYRLSEVISYLRALDGLPHVACVNV